MRNPVYRKKNDFPTEEFVNKVAEMCCDLNYAILTNLTRPIGIVGLQKQGKDLKATVL